MKRKNNLPLKLGITSNLHAIMLIICLLGVIFHWIYLLYHFASLPNIIPIHFDGQGKANGFGNKYTLILLPFIHSIISIGLWWMVQHPHQLNYPITITNENANKKYAQTIFILDVIHIGITILFIAITVYTVRYILQLPFFPIQHILSFALLIVCIPLFFVYKAFR